MKSFIFGLVALVSSPALANDELHCQGMKGENYVTLSSAALTDVPGQSRGLAYRESAPLGGVLPAFKPVRTLLFTQVPQLSRASATIYTGFATGIAFAGGGTISYTLVIENTKPQLPAVLEITTDTWMNGRFKEVILLTCN